MNPAAFSTAGVPPPRQLDAWRGWFDEVYEVETPEDAPEGFAASTALWMLDGVTFGRVTAPALRANRSFPLIRRNPVDHWVIAIGARAPTRIAWRDSVLLLPADTPFIASLGDRMTSERGADDRLHLYLPRDRFACLAPALDAARGVPVAGPLGALLRDYMLSMERHLPAIDEGDLPRLTEAVRAMVTACIVPSRRNAEGATEQVNLVRLERARQAIRRHLRSARLGPALLCREIGISRSQLYRLFEGEGGVVRYILRCRLTAAYATLADPLDQRRISAIGEAYGFFDASSFSRAFRREFGVSPGDLRAGSLPPQRTRTPQAEGLSLKACLRAF